MAAREDTNSQVPRAGGYAASWSRTIERFTLRDGILVIRETTQK